jgi:hypothetical protein
MPTLQNARHEAFALARAGGAKLEDAYEDAGFAPSATHACRLARRDDVAERIAELRHERQDASHASPQAIIAALVAAARDANLLKTPAGAKEARLNLIEAHKLQLSLTEQRDGDRLRIYRCPS